MSKIRRFLLIIAIILVLVLGAVWYWNSYTRVKFIASGHPQWPPIMYQVDSDIIGVGPEITAKVFGDLGVKIASKYEGPWDVVQEKAKSGEVDVLVAAYKTTERETYMDYSIPYTVDPVVLVVKKGNAFPYIRWEDLVVKKGVVTNGDSYGQEFDNFIKDKLTVKKVGTAEEAFDSLLNGETDYFVYALYSASDYIFRNKLTEQVEILPQYVSTENFYLTISKKSALVKYLPQINTLLEKYKNDGTIQGIIDKYQAQLWQSPK